MYLLPQIFLLVCLTSSAASSHNTFNSSASFRLSSMSLEYLCQAWPPLIVCKRSSGGSQRLQWGLGIRFRRYMNRKHYFLTSIYQTIYPLFSRVRYLPDNLPPYFKETLYTGKRIMNFWHFFGNFIIFSQYFTILGQGSWC